MELIATPSPVAGYLDFIVNGDYVDQLASLQKNDCKRYNFNNSVPARKRYCAQRGLKSK